MDDGEYVIGDGEWMIKNSRSVFAPAVLLLLSRLSYTGFGIYDLVCRKVAAGTVDDILHPVIQVSAAKPRGVEAAGRQNRMTGAARQIIAESAVPAGVDVACDPDQFRLVARCGTAFVIGNGGILQGFEQTVIATCAVLQRVFHEVEHFFRFVRDGACREIIPGTPTGSDFRLIRHGAAGCCRQAGTGVIDGVNRLAEYLVRFIRMQNRAVSAGAGTGEHNLIPGSLCLGPAHRHDRIEITGMVDRFASQTAGIFHGSVAHVNVAGSEGNEYLCPVAERVAGAGVVPDPRGIGERKR